MHVPPGLNAFATQYVRDFIAWPFLSARYNSELPDALASPSGSVFYAIAGHTHRFDFRLAGGVPIVVLGALSPIYDNNPAYYALRLAPDGVAAGAQLRPDVGSAKRRRSVACAITCEDSGLVRRA